MNSPALDSKPKFPNMMISQYGGSVDISLADAGSGDPTILAEQIHGSWGDPEHSSMLVQVEHIRLDAAALPEDRREELRAALEARFSRPVVLRR